MSSWRFTPLERGFDSYYGYLGGGEVDAGHKNPKKTKNFDIFHLFVPSILSHFKPG